MKSLGANLKLSAWLEAIVAQIGHEGSTHGEFRLSLVETAAFMDVLNDAAKEAVLLERRAETAPPLLAPDNVLQFVPRPRAVERPTGGDAA